MVSRMKDKLKKTLSEKRYKHSLGVCDEALKLARIFGADEEKAYIAGLLHDCAKGYDIDKQIELCAEYGIELDKITLACKKNVRQFYINCGFTQTGTVYEIKRG